MVVDLEEARTAFYAMARSEEVPFVVNDVVDLVTGPHAGTGGALISIESVDPLTYLVERGDGGGDLLVPAKNLRLRQP
ncbi:MAG: hypothetical protein NXI35_13375 [bacterium]|nr:hypothetical protein [bacterium]